MMIRALATSHRSLRKGLSLSLFLGIHSFGLLAPLSTQAEEISPAARLRKISLQIRGLLPAEQEYTELKNTSSDKLELFYKDKATEYSKSAWAETKFMERVFEDLRLDVPSTVMDPQYNYNTNNSADANMMATFKTAGDLTPRLKPRTIELFNSLMNSGRLALKAGNLDRLYLSDFFAEVNTIFALSNSANDAARSQKMQMFLKIAKEAGHKLDSVASIEEALVDFKTNPSKFKDPTQEFLKLSDLNILKEIQKIIMTSLESAATRKGINSNPYGNIPKGVETPAATAAKKLTEILKKITAADVQNPDPVLALAATSKMNEDLQVLLRYLRSSYGGGRNNSLQLEFQVEMLAAPAKKSQKKAQAKPRGPSRQWATNLTLRDIEFQRLSCALKALVQKTKIQNVPLANSCLAPDPSLGFALDQFPKIASLIIARANAVSSYGDAATLKFANFDYAAANAQILDLMIQNSAKFSGLGAQTTGSSLRPNVTSFYSLNEVDERYMKTKFSKSASFFRIFFCDEMRPVALVDQSTKSLKALQGLKFNGTTGTPSTIPKDSEDDHVKADCAACHRKLDPIQLLFGLNNKKTAADQPFELVYDDDTGKEHRVKVAKASELLPTVSKQEQYLACQTSKFWKWMIGEDMPLSTEERKALMTKFEELGRDPKAFMVHLTTLPQFYKDDALTLPPNFSSVRPILGRCNSCHSTVDTSIIPSFTQLPISNVANKDDRPAQLKEHEDFMKYIVKYTDLPNSGKKVEMPPPKAGWKLSETERNALARWIFHGGLDDNNQRTLSKEFVDQFVDSAEQDVVKAAEAPSEVNATFRPTWKRFLENSDLRKVLMQKLPIELSNCRNQMDEDRTSLGTKDKLTGLPVSDTVNHAFREAYSKCIVSSLTYVKQTIARNGNEVRSDLLRLMGLDAFVQSPTELSKLNVEWQTLAEKDKQDIITRIKSYYLGTEVYSSNEMNRFDRVMQIGLENFLQRKTNARTMDVALIAVYLTLNDDKFLSY